MVTKEFWKLIEIKELDCYNLLYTCGADKKVHAKIFKEI